jgi:hypothetical protein
MHAYVYYYSCMLVSTYVDACYVCLMRNTCTRRRAHMYVIEADTHIPCHVHVNVVEAHTCMPAPWYIIYSCIHSPTYMLISEIAGADTHTHTHTHARTHAHTHNRGG